MPQCTRTLPAGSVLGLPSTFSEKPYSLTAVLATDCDITHVSGKKFLDLMKSHIDLCREATDILSREVAFILSSVRSQPGLGVGDTRTTRGSARSRCVGE